MLQLLVALTVFALPAVLPMAPARADNASTLLTLVNNLRAARGARPLAVDPALTQAAQAWSAHMVTAGLVHNPSLSTEVPGGWTQLGENIGEGGSVAILFNAFVDSPFHYANMINPVYNLTGIGVAVGANGTLWITQDFEGKGSIAPVTTISPATTPTTRSVATTAAPTAPPTTAPRTTTSPPAAAPPTTAGVVTTTIAVPTAAAGGGGSGALAQVPPPPDTTTPAGLAAAASISARPTRGATTGRTALVSLAVLTVLADSAVVVHAAGRRRDRSWLHRQ